MSGHDESAARYPLGDHESGRIHSWSGVPFDEITLEAVREGRLDSGDLTISAETLRLQAGAAERSGYRQLAGNLRRAAELTAIPNERLLQVYEALRPHRSTYQELIDLADELEARHGAAVNAALIRQAADAYRDGGLLRSENATEQG